MKCTPKDVVGNIHDYLNYCVQDVFVTHAAFSKVLPAFLEHFPSPVSFGGILEMGSSFLMVNESRDAYLANVKMSYWEPDGHINHSVFWKDLAPASREGKRTSGTMKHGPLKQAIGQTFCSLNELKKQFSVTAAAIQGSGWAGLDLKMLRLM
ncbi:hypothetical protein AZE42_06094 [Rhizopogon vesiculosus]|uniref:Manganese/iron superoxide dismutase C-terminal domain-containing protein n=1 Tax=Rhizopogon vesiculosus TaxID=180088 RepID=A0A1J8Q4X7_9AGAM|nr:hypothetical protein AZE42_06094 [Rhizopogon vesiculosus]